MDVETLSLSGTDYEDIILRDTSDFNSSDGLLAAPTTAALEASVVDALAPLVRSPGAESLGESLGVRLHEALGLLLSALTVVAQAAHGLLNLRSWVWVLSWSGTLLLTGLGLTTLYALTALFAALRTALVYRLFRDDDNDEVDGSEEDGVDEDDADEDDADEEVIQDVGELSTGQISCPDPQPALPAPPALPAEVEGVVSAQQEREARVRHWLDAQGPHRAISPGITAGGSNPISAYERKPILFARGGSSALPPLPPLPLLLPPAELAALSPKGRRALSLAYELSLAVRHQLDRGVRASLSAPSPSAAASASARGQASSQAPGQVPDAWKLVQCSARSALDEPKDPFPAHLRAPQSSDPSDLMQPIPPSALRRSSVSYNKGWPAGPERVAAVEAVLTPPVSDNPSPTATPAKACQSVDNPAPAASAVPALNSSASLFSFVRRFSGTRFLLRELTGVAGTANTSEGLRFRATVPGPASASTEGPGRATSTVVLPCVDESRENVMKVFSKGILSESTIDFSTTSIASVSRPDAPVETRAGTGAASATQKTVAEEGQACSGGPGPAANRGFRADVSIGTTTSEGLSANMSDEGMLRRGPTHPQDLEDDHKSVYDLKKSPLTSIPEAAPPDEDATAFS